MILCFSHMQEEAKGLKLAVTTHWNRLEKGQKVFFAVFVLCALVALFFGYLNVRDGIYAPFRVSIKSLEQNKDLLKDPDQVATDYQKRIDTDGDGLSDWDEENLYHTSPYLWSTAGDGIPDNVKIAKGENPLCKSGENCTADDLTYNLATDTLPMASVLQTDVKSEVSNLVYGNSSINQGLQQQAQAQGIDISTENAIRNDPSLLRQALLQSGKVTQSDLDKVTDQDLLKLFDQAVSQTKPTQGATGTTATAPVGSLTATATAQDLP